MIARLTLSLLLLWSARAAVAQELSLNDYLNEIEETNGNYRAAVQRVKGYALSREEANLMFTPRLEALAQSTRDGAYPNSPGFMFDRNDIDVYSLGVRQQFEFGLNAALKYEMTELRVVNARFEGPGGAQSLPFENWNATPKLELSMPLWQNALGRSVRAQRDSSYLSSSLEMESARAKVLDVRIRAQSLYWQLAAIRETVRIQEEAFNRAQALLKFVQDRASLDLRDKSDVLQTKASVEAGRLDLKKARDDERSLAREFNRLRGKPGDAAIPKLKNLEIAQSLPNLPDQRPGDLPNFTITKTQLELARASAVSAEEGVKPELNLFGSYALNGRDSDFSGAVSDITDANRPSYSYGIRFSMPLSRSTADSARSGARIRQSLVEEDLRFQGQDQEEQWRDLVERYRDAQERLKLALIITEAQEAKLNEQRRLMRSGRSSLFNVLTFEQDFLRSELSRVQSAYEVVLLNVQSQLFSGSEK